jgi:hypothetical protein
MKNKSIHEVSIEIPIPNGIWAKQISAFETDNFGPLDVLYIKSNSSYSLDEAKFSLIKFVENISKAIE